MARLAKPMTDMHIDGFRSVGPSGAPRALGLLLSSWSSGVDR